MAQADSMSAPSTKGPGQSSKSLPPIGDHETALVFIRHGSTLRNEPPEKIRGWDDIPLDENGLQEAYETGEKLSKYNIVRIYTSDLSRAKVTADIISGMNPNTPPVLPTPELRPWNLGDMQGQPVKTILSDMLNYQTKKPDIPVPGGEPFNRFLVRCLSIVRKLFSLTSALSGVVVVVTHTRDIRAVSAWIAAGARGFQVDQKVMTQPEEAAPGGIVIARMKPGGIKIETPEADEGE